MFKDEEIMNIKKPWMSKRIWLNFIVVLIGVVAAWFPDIKEYLNEEMLLIALGFFNLILTTTTKNKIKFWD